MWAVCTADTMSYYDQPQFGLTFQSPWEVLARAPKPIKEPAPKRVYIQMTKAQKSASAFMTVAERKAWREQMAQPKASSFNTQIPDQAATDRSNSIARTK